MRIAIVNDMNLAVEVLRRIVDSVPSYSVAWIARDGAEAIAKCAADRPDLILMDMVMPIKDGVAATREIMKNTPCPILIVTARMSANLDQVFEAMGAGALEVVTTPTMGMTGSVAGAAALLAKIETIFKLTAPGKTGDAAAEVAPPKTVIAPSSLPPVVAIGASTGGPQALAEVLSRLPVDLQAAVVITQHMDAEFVQGLADWLSDRSLLPVKLAVQGDELKAGTVLVAATSDHLVIDASHRLAYTPEPRATPYRPSADVLFESLAAHGPRHGVCVLLTGMGRDGARGMLRLRQRGWHTIAQSQESCVVFGMPKAAIELNASVQTLPVEQIAHATVRQIPVPASTTIPSPEGAQP